MCFYSLKLNTYQIHHVHLIHLMGPSSFQIATEGIFWAHFYCKMAFFSQRKVWGEEERMFG